MTKEILVTLRATRGDRRTWGAAARRAGLSLSAWLRRLAAAACAAEPEPAPAPAPERSEP